MRQITGNRWSINKQNFIWIWKILLSFWIFWCLSQLEISHGEANQRKFIDWTRNQGYTDGPRDGPRDGPSWSEIFFMFWSLSGPVPIGFGLLIPAGNLWGHKTVSGDMDLEQTVLNCTKGVMYEIYKILENSNSFIWYRLQTFKD